MMFTDISLGFVWTPSVLLPVEPTVALVNEQTAFEC